MLWCPPSLTFYFLEVYCNQMEPSSPRLLPAPPPEPTSVRQGTQLNYEDANSSGDTGALFELEGRGHQDEEVKIASLDLVCNCS